MATNPPILCRTAGAAPLSSVSGARRDFTAVLLGAFSAAVILSEVEIRPKGGSNEHSEVRDLGGKSAAILGLLTANVIRFVPQNASCILRDPHVGLSCPP